MTTKLKNKCRFSPAIREIQRVDSVRHFAIPFEEEISPQLEAIDLECVRDRRRLFGGLNFAVRGKGSHATPRTTSLCRQPE